MGVFTVLIPRRRNHPEHVVEMELRIRRLERSHQDGRAAKGHSGLNKVPSDPFPDDSFYCMAEILQFGRTTVCQTSASYLFDDCGWIFSQCIHWFTLISDSRMDPDDIACD